MQPRSTSHSRERPAPSAPPLIAGIACRLARNRALRRTRRHREALQCQESLGVSKRQYPRKVLACGTSSDRGASGTNTGRADNVLADLRFGRSLAHAGVLDKGGKESPSGVYPVVDRDHRAEQSANTTALIACDLVLVGRFGTNSRVEKSARQARRSDPMGVY